MRYSRGGHVVSIRETETNLRSGRLYRTWMQCDRDMEELLEQVKEVMIESLSGYCAAPDGIDEGILTRMGILSLMKAAYFERKG
jgi:hypothetical protein